MIGHATLPGPYNMPSANYLDSASLISKWAGSASGFPWALAPQYNQIRRGALLPCSAGNGCGTPALAAIPFEYNLDCGIHI